MLNNTVNNKIDIPKEEGEKIQDKIHNNSQHLKDNERLSTICSQRPLSKVSLKSENCAIILEYIHDHKSIPFSVKKPRLIQKFIVARS